MKLYLKVWLKQTEAPISTISSAFSTRNLLPKTSLWAWVCKRFRSPEFRFECQVQAEPQINSKQNPLWILRVSPVFYLKELQCSLETWPKFACNSTAIQFSFAERFANLHKMGCWTSYDLWVSKEVYQSFQQTSTELLGPGEEWYIFKL